MTAWRLYHVPDETGSLKLINLLQCCIIIIIFYLLCSYFFLYKTNVSVVKKRVHIKKQMIIVNIVCSVLANDKVLNHYRC